MLRTLIYLCGVFFSFCFAFCLKNKIPTFGLDWCFFEIWIFLLQGMDTKNMISHVYKGNSQIITSALRYIHRNYQNKLSLQEVSEELHVNSSYFSALFRQEISMTFTDYLNQLRIGQACHLLTDTEMSIMEIAAAVGFDDQSYFTRVFRKYKGITPHAYRKSAP